MRKLLRSGAAVTLSLAALFAFPAIAIAHDELTSTSPTNNQVLTAPPKQLVLRFEEPPLKGTAKVAASSTTGTAVDLPAPKTDGSTITVAWPTGTPAGSYVVSWRNVGADGHPLSGQFGFGYAAPAGSSTGPSATTSPAATPSVSVSPISSNTSSDSSSSTSWLLPTLAGVLIVAVVIIGLAIRRNINKDS